jgi:hypothetical protein
MLPRQTQDSRSRRRSNSSNSAAEKEEEAASLRFGNAPGPIVGLLLISVVGVRVSRALGSPPRALSLATWQNYARFRQFFSVLVSWNVPIRMG